MKIGLMEGVIAGVVGLTIIIGINMAVTNTMIDKAVTEYAQSVPAPAKVIVVDMDLIVKDLTSQGIKPFDVLLYTQTLNALLVKEGYLVIDSQSALSYHPRYAFNPIPSEKLFEAAQKAGIDLVKENRDKMEEALKKGKEKIDDLLSVQ